MAVPVLLTARFMPSVHTQDYIPKGLCCLFPTAVIASPMSLNTANIALCLQFDLVGLYSLLWPMIETKFRAHCANNPDYSEWLSRAHVNYHDLLEQVATMPPTEELEYLCSSSPVARAVIKELLTIKALKKLFSLRKKFR